MLEILYPLERTLWNIFVHEFFQLNPLCTISCFIRDIDNTKKTLKEIPLFEKYDN